jgi:hypothetical protein
MTMLVSVRLRDANIGQILPLAISILHDSSFGEFHNLHVIFWMKLNQIKVDRVSLVLVW